MGKSPCCDKLVLKKGPWTPEEDQKLLAFIEEHGHGNWRALPSKAGLQRCGKSCRLRWTNYLRPDIKRGKFTLQEEQTIIQLHALLGNRWSAIATHLPKRTDNEIKNYWNTHLKKRLAKMGIDPVTHKSKNDALHSAGGGHQSKTNLSHMAQWESARLEAEARLVRQSKLKSASCSNNNIMCDNNNYSCVTAPSLDLHVNDNHHQIVPSVSLGSLSCSSSTSAHHYLTSITSVGVSCNFDPDTNTNTNTNIAPRCLDVVKPWQSGGVWPSTTCSNTSANNDGFMGISMGSTEIDGGDGGGNGGGGVGLGIESPTSTLSFSENNAPLGVPNMGTIEFMRNHHEVIHDINATNSLEERQGDDNDDGDDDKDYDDDDDDANDGNHHGHGFMEGFTELLLSNNNTTTATKNVMSCERSQQEDNKTYWNSILNLVNSSPSHSPMF